MAAPAQVCSLPWRQSDEEDEVAEVEKTLRQHTRYTVPEFERRQAQEQRYHYDGMQQDLNVVRGRQGRAGHAVAWLGRLIDWSGR